MLSLGESPWRSDQWAMVFEAGFRVNFAIVFVIVLVSFCVKEILPICGPWDIRVLDLFIQMLKAHQQLHFKSDMARITMQYQ